MSKTKTPPPSGSEYQRHGSSARPSAVDDRLVSTGDAAAVDQFLRDAPAAYAWLRSVVETNARSPLPEPPAELGYFAAAVEVIRGHADGQAMLRAVVARAECRHDDDRATARGPIAGADGARPAASSIWATVRGPNRQHPGDEAMRDGAVAPALPRAPANGQARQIAELRRWIQGVAQRVRLLNSRVQPSRRTGPTLRTIAGSRVHQVAEFADWIRKIVPAQVHGPDERRQAQMAPNASVKETTATPKSTADTRAGAETRRRSPARRKQGGERSRPASPNKSPSHPKQNRGIATVLKALFLALHPNIPQGPIDPRAVDIRAARRRGR